MVYESLPINDQVALNMSLQWLVHISAGVKQFLTSITKLLR